jgi:hypothetical protein
MAGGYTLQTAMGIQTRPDTRLSFDALLPTNAMMTTMSPRLGPGVAADSLRTSIMEGKYVNLALLLMPESEYASCLRLTQTNSGEF